MLDSLRLMKAPGTVNVTDAVMEQVSALQLPRRIEFHPKWGRYIAVAAACIAALVAVNVTRLYTRSYNETGICEMFADVYGYNTPDESTAFYAELDMSHIINFE